jgi:UDP-N-acetylmuramate--alanine ligase
MYNPKLQFHFTGIGGSGMSGIAEILMSLGFKVSGSDLKPSAVIERLRQMGADIKLGHAAENIPQDASLLVYSSAVLLDNPEVLEAKRRHLPVVRRAEVLAELMRLKFGVAVAGSHGKTTTTSMIGHVLETAGLDPTVIIGGRVKALGSGGKLGKGNFLVAESDESDRSFLLLKPSIAVVTNIEAEHMNAYSSLRDLEQSFEQFVHAVPFYGLAVLCIDDPKVRDMAARLTCRTVTYGFSADAELRAGDIVPSRHGTTYSVMHKDKALFRVTLPMLGSHIALNSLAAVAVARELDLPAPQIQAALESFSGVARRLELCAEVQGISVMNEYGHHPTEVKATLKAVRQAFGAELRRLHVIFQPHRYTRTRDCFAEFLEAFHDADSVWVSDIYAAGEAPLEDVSAEKLAAAIVHPACCYVSQLDEIVVQVMPEVRPGDVVLCLGAGSVGGLPDKIIKELARAGTTQLGIQ